MNDILFQEKNLYKSLLRRVENRQLKDTVLLSNKMIKKKLLKIGLTGGVGAGKTTVSEIFKKLGVPVFNSDNCAKKLLKNNKTIIQQVIQSFGKSILENNQINTKRLGKIVFSSKKNIEILNKIIHPHVIDKFNQWDPNTRKKYLIKESAILFESNTYQQLDKIILVTAPLETRINRVCDRDNRSKEEVQNIINQQLNQNVILKHVDYKVNNDSHTLLVPQIIKLDKILSQI